MKSTKLLILALASALLLTGCTGSSKKIDETADELREKYLEIDGFSAEAGIKADYGDRVWEFTIAYTGSAESGTITVLYPDTVSGLTANYDNGSASLTFDGTVLDTGSLTENGLTPIGAVPMLIKAWREGCVIDSYSEVLDGVDSVVVETELPDGLSQKTWFSTVELLPIRSELSEGGKTLIICVFKNAFCD